MKYRLTLELEGTAVVNNGNPGPVQNYSDGLEIEAAIRDFGRSVRFEKVHPPAPERVEVVWEA